MNTGKSCATCKHFSEEDSICCNVDGSYCGCFTDKNHSCKKWEYGSLQEDDDSNAEWKITPKGIFLSSLFDTHFN